MRAATARVLAEVPREGIEARNIGDERRPRQHIPPKPGGRPDAPHDLEHGEPAVIQQLADPTFSGDEVVSVVDVPEERALLQVVGDDDNEHAVGPQHAVSLAHPLARCVDARHVFEHLVGIDDIL